MEWFLCQEERIEIADLHLAGASIRQIAGRLKRAPSTISRELRRKASATGGYGPFEAHRHAIARRARHPHRRLDTTPALATVVAKLLSQRWSPQQISRHLRRTFREQPVMWLCHEHLPGRLPAEIGAAAPDTAGAAPTLAAAYWTRPPPSPAASRAPPAPVRAADAHHP
jgi:hypothetical protein